MSFKRDAVISTSLVAAFCVVLATLPSCTSPAPLSPIYPPGWTPSKAVNNTPLAVKKAIVSPPLPTIMLTCDFGDGPRDGEHIYVGKQVGSFGNMLTFPPTNIFTVPCDNNTPSFIELRSFVNWPAPYVVDTFTNDDETTGSITNTFYESSGADFVFVPTGCQSIGLFNYGSNLVVAGWAVGGKVYQILSAPTLGTPATNWQTNATFTGTNGPYQVSVGQAGTEGYYRTMGQ